MSYDLSHDKWLRPWRKILTKRIWLETNPVEKTVMITLLLMVNFKPTEATWKDKTITLKPGSMIVTLDDILYVSKIDETTHEIGCILDRFETPFEFLKQKMLKNDQHKRLITILNWKQYQQDGLSNAESEERKEKALVLYNFYLERISPLRKSKVRAIPNILKHCKKYSFKDMSKAINNYRPTAISYDPEFRKDPANFFGIQEPYFKDYMPGAFNPEKFSGRSIQNDDYERELLTPERLEKLNA